MKARSRQFMLQFLVVFLVFLAVVEEAEKKQCWKCRGLWCWKCSGWKCYLKWIYNPERVREFSRKYGEEHKEDEKAYNQQYNRREVECESCGSSAWR